MSDGKQVFNTFFGKSSEQTFKREKEIYGENIGGQILLAISGDEKEKYIEVNGQKIDISRNTRSQDVLQALLDSEIGSYLPDYATYLLKRRIQNTQKTEQNPDPKDDQYSILDAIGADRIINIEDRNIDTKAQLSRGDGLDLLG